MSSMVQKSQSYSSMKLAEDDIQEDARIIGKRVVAKIKRAKAKQQRIRELKREIEKKSTFGEALEEY